MDTKVSIVIPALQGTPLAARYEVSRLPRLHFEETGSVATSGDSDRMRAVGGGRYLYVEGLDASDGRSLLHVASGETVWTAEKDQWFSGIFRDHLILTRDKQLHVSPLCDLASVRTVPGYQGVGPTADERMFYALDEQRHLCRLDPTTGQLEWRAERPWPEGAVLSAWISPCGQFFMGQTGHSDVQVWRIDPPQKIGEATSGRSQITKLRAHPTRPIFAWASMGATVGWIDCARPYACVRMPMASEVRGLAFSQDGRYLCATSSDQYELVWVLDFEKQRLFQPLKLSGDPWGLAVVEGNRLAVAQTRIIRYFSFREA